MIQDVKNIGGIEMNKEELLMCNARETLEIANKCIQKLDDILNQISFLGYKCELDLETIDSSTLDSNNQHHKLNAILMKDLSNEKR